MKKIISIIIMLLLVQLVSGTYYSNKDHCIDKIDYEKFIAPCPHDHRSNDNYLLTKHYTVNESISYCLEGKLIQQDCNFTLLPWFHPKVTGNGGNIPKTEMIQSATGVPEFGPFGLFMAITCGIGCFIWQRKR